MEANLSTREQAAGRWAHAQPMECPDCSGTLEPSPTLIGFFRCPDCNHYKFEPSWFGAAQEDGAAAGL